MTSNELTLFFVWAWFENYQPLTPFENRSKGAKV